MNDQRIVELLGQPIFLQVPKPKGSKIHKYLLECGYDSWGGYGTYNLNWDVYYKGYKFNNRLYILLDDKEIMVELPNTFEINEKYIQSRTRPAKDTSLTELLILLYNKIQQVEDRLDNI